MFPGIVNLFHSSVISGQRNTGQGLKEPPLAPQKDIERKLRLSAPEHEQAYLDLITECFEKAETRFQKLCLASQLKKALQYLKEINITLSPQEALQKAFAHSGINYARPKMARAIRSLAKQVTLEQINRTSSTEIFKEIDKLKREALSKSESQKHILLFGESHVVVENSEAKLINPGNDWIESHLEKFKAAGYNTLVMEKPQNLPEGSKRPGAKDFSYCDDREYLEMFTELRNLLMKKFGSLTIEDQELREFFQRLGNYIIEQRQAMKGRRPIQRLISNPNNMDKTRARWAKLIEKARAAGFKVVFVDSTMRLRDKLEIVNAVSKRMINNDSNSQIIQDIKHYLRQKYALYMNMRDRSISAGIEAAANAQDTRGIIGIFGASHLANFPVHGYKTAYQRMEAQGLPLTTLRLEFEGIKENTNKTYLAGKYDINRGKAKIMNLKNNPLVYSSRYANQLKFSRESGKLHTKLVKSPSARTKPHFNAVIYCPYTSAA